MKSVAPPTHTSATKCNAYGYTDIDMVCEMIARTAVFDVPTIRSLLYVTIQHTAAVRTQAEALAVLARSATRRWCT